MKHMAYGILLASTLLVACQQVTNNGTESDLSAVKNQLQEIEETLLTSDIPIETLLQQYLGYFVDDLVLLPPDGGAVQGYDAALAFYTEGFAGGTVVAVDYHLYEPEIFIEGDMAIRRYFAKTGRW